MRDLVISCLESRVENNRSIYARFVLAPFKKGDALTFGTALRRALLSQIEGIAIIALDIQGITHEFCTIPGVRESVLELSLNFQQIVLRNQTSLDKLQVGYLQMRGPASVYANDLNLPYGIECVDPTQYIATLSQDGLLIVKFLIGKAIKSEDLKRNKSVLTTQKIREARQILKKQNSRQTDSDKDSTIIAQLKTTQKIFQSNSCFQNIIPLDSFCTPVNRTNFAIQIDELSNQARERLLLEIWTNGSVHPRQAIQSAVMSLITLFSGLKKLIHLDSYSLGIGENLSPEIQVKLKKQVSFLYKSDLDKMSLLSSDLSNLSLSLKTYTFLKQKRINRLENLLDFSSKEILKLVNGNKKMFYDIKRCIDLLGIENLNN